MDSSVPTLVGGALDLLAAALCGVLLGFEREKHGKAIGIKTGMLVVVGAATYVLAGRYLAGAWHGSNDQTRVTAYVVSGIGFLGAGLILHSRGAVTGLTSAATVWLMGAIGVIAGAGLRLAALLISAAVVALLLGLRRAEDLLFTQKELLSCDILFDARDPSHEADLRRAFSHFFPGEGVRFRGEGERGVVEVRGVSPRRLPRSVLADLWNIPGVIEIRQVREGGSRIEDRG